MTNSLTNYQCTTLTVSPGMAGGLGKLRNYFSKRMQRSVENCMETIRADEVSGLSVSHWIKVWINCQMYHFIFLLQLPQLMSSVGFCSYFLCTSVYTKLSTETFLGNSVNNANEIQKKPQEVV